MRHSGEMGHIYFSACAASIVFNLFCSTKFVQMQPSMHVLTISLRTTSRREMKRKTEKERDREREIEKESERVVFFCFPRHNN